MEQLLKVRPPTACRRGLALLGLVLLVPLVVAGCAHPTDVGPFADATAALRSAVAESGRTVEAQVRDLSTRVDPASRAKVVGQADALAKEWAVRVQVMDSVVNYTDSLRLIVDAGNHGADSAKAVAAGVSNIAESAGIAVPPMAAVGVALDAAAFIYAQIARARAAASLEESLTLSQPALERIAVQMRSDMKSIDDILIIVGDDAGQRIRLSDQYKGLRNYREFLAEERRKLWAKNQEMAGQLSTTDGARLASLDQQIAATEPLAADFDHDMNVVQTRTGAQRALLTAGVEALDRVALAHAQLVRAVKEHRPINQESLIEAAVELRALIKRVREL